VGFLASVHFHYAYNEAVITYLRYINCLNSREIEELKEGLNNISCGTIETRRINSFASKGYNLWIPA